MKRLIFLLLLVTAFVGFVSAQEVTTEPPWDISLIAEMSCNCADCFAIKQDTVFEMVVLNTVQPSNYSTVVINNDNKINTTTNNHYRTPNTRYKIDYYLLL